MLHDEFIPGIVKEQDLELARAEHFEVRAALGGFAVGRQQVIDFLLIRGHALDVIGQGRALALSVAERFVAQQFAEASLWVKSVTTPSLMKALILAVKLVVALRLLFGALFQELQEAAGQHLVELLHQRGVLHRLARDVQRQIFAVDDALEKAQPIREKSLGFGLDQDFAAVEVAPRIRSCAMPSVSKLRGGTKRSAWMASGASEVKCRR